MSRGLRLADYAAVERDGREKFYPQQVAKGEISLEAAEADWRCWIAIADYFTAPWEQPQFPQWDLSWSDLATAAKRALARREQACAGNKEQRLAGPLADRRDAVAAMADRLERTAEFYRTLNDQLRREAAERRKQKEAA